MREISQQSEVRDGMRIEWDVGITADDGLVLRADVYRPIEEGQYPVILTYGPYAKGLPFQEGYRDQWEKMVAEHPEVAARSTNKYQNWEVVDPEKLTFSHEIGHYQARAETSASSTKLTRQPKCSAIASPERRAAF